MNWIESLFKIAGEDFILWNGNRALIKKQMFERYVDTKMSVI